MTIKDIFISILSTTTVIYVVHVMRECYKRKEWFFFAVEVIFLIAVIAAIMVGR